VRVVSDIPCVSLSKEDCTHVYHIISLHTTDCENDNDCLGDLKCFKRNKPSDDRPPGCKGNRWFAANYCYDPVYEDCADEKGDFEEIQTNLGSTFKDGSAVQDLDKSIELLFGTKTVRPFPSLTLRYLLFKRLSSFIMINIFADYWTSMCLF